MDKAHATMHIDEAKGRLKTRFQTAFILKVFRRRLRLSESWKQWFEQQKTRACVPHTPYTSVLKFVPFAGGVCGAATHAVGHAGYACYPSGLKFMPPAGRVCGTATHAVGHAGYACYPSGLKFMPPA
ncbi:TPA: hypothetical protein ACQWFD_002063, partial [Neisseria subflava]